MDTPALEHLVAAYFHQDWCDQYESIDEAVADFVRGSPSFIGSVIADIDRTLAAFPEDRALEEYLDLLGSEYNASSRPGGYRGWLLYLRKVVEEELSQAQTAGTSSGRSHPTADDV